MYEQLNLTIALGDHMHVRPIKDGRVTSPRLKFHMVDYQPLPAAFRTMIRTTDLDVSEMAVASHVLACGLGKPLVGLAIPLWSRLPHTNLVCRSDDQRFVDPRALEGKRVGVRAYGQTSGVWVRGVLKHQYNVDLDKITWVTMEDAHAAEFRDPPGTERHQGPETLRQLLLAGQLDAIMGERTVDPDNIQSLIAGAADAAKTWLRAEALTPINHVISLRRELVTAHPWLPAELADLFMRAREQASGEDGEAPPPYGLESNRRSLQRVIDYCAEQHLTHGKLSVDELFCADGLAEQGAAGRALHDH